MANPQRENGFTAISNEVMEALAKIRIAGESRQMLDVIIRKTYGFNKKSDRIATSQFKNLTGLTNMALHKAREKLVKMNLITITKKGNSQILTYSFQKDHDKWKPLPKKVTVTNKDMGVTQKGNEVLPKKVMRCYPKGDTQKKERNYTKETITKDIEKWPYLKKGDFKKSFEYFLDMRIKIKKPATERAKELVLIKLSKHDIVTAQKMLEQSILHNWQDVYKLKEERDGTHKPSSGEASQYAGLEEEINV